MIENPNFNTQAAVFGGEGNMGKLTRKLFEEIGYSTMSIDPRREQSSSEEEALRQSKVIFFSILPVDSIQKIIENNIDLFDGHIVLDNASIKQPFISALKKLDQRGISVCSTHPMCKHDQPLFGQKALILEVGSSSQNARVLAEALYQKAGMTTLPLSLEKHDSAMAIVQFMPHMVMRSVGQVFEKEGVDPKLLRDIAPANFQLFYLSMWRTLVQDPKVSSTILLNILKQAEGKRLANELQESITQIVQQRDVDGLTTMLQESYDRLNDGQIGPTMNEVSTTILDRISNLNVKSLAIDVQSDRPGLLRSMLIPFEDHGMNLTAIDSHRRNGALRFELGIDQTTYSVDAMMNIVRDLESMGFSVAEFIESH